MTKRVLTGIALLFPFAASADMLIMRDGRTMRGTFNRADTTRMNFTEYNGRSQDVNVTDVQELRFGNDQQQQQQQSQQPYSSSNPNNGGYPVAGGNPGYGNPPGANPAMGDDLERLRQDLRAAMDNNNFPPEQRQVLEDARETLRGAIQQNRAGRPLNQRNIRLALDSIRNSTDRMQRQDRDRLNDDIRRISASMGGQQGRDY